jgi:hypothetical protein
MESSSTRLIKSCQSLSLPQLKISAAFLTDPSGARIELTEGLAH